VTGVIIAADERDKKMWVTQPRILTDHLADAIVILSLTEAKRLHIDCAVIICGGEHAALSGIGAHSGAVAVVDSANVAALRQIGESSLPAITCGLSARDTLTLTSFSRDSAVLAVQRSITCFDGTVFEPQETPFFLADAIDSFVLMAAGAVFLLTGNAEKLKNAVI
jgi:hypothetical protein